MTRKSVTPWSPTGFKPSSKIRPFCFIFSLANRLYYKKNTQEPARAPQRGQSVGKKGLQTAQFTTGCSHCAGNSSQFLYFFTVDKIYFPSSLFRRRPGSFPLFLCPSLSPTPSFSSASLTFCSQCPPKGGAEGEMGRGGTERCWCKKRNRP